jgi:dTDP-4-amino-4,6-dideoxygalactose transaminase
MLVPLLDLKQQYAPLREEIETAIREICDSQQFVLGPHVARLEEAIASYCGAGRGIGVSSGTDALLLALMALGIGRNDEVITTPFSFFATAGTIARLGARPVFCDIELESLNLSADRVTEFIEEQCEFDGARLLDRATGGAVKAMMPVHLFGRMADMDRFMALGRKYSLPVVEDAAQAIGAELADGRRAASIGEIGCLSFFPTKNLGAFGDAGMCMTSDPELAERMTLLRVHGGERRYYHAMIGGNFRLDALQAAVLSVKLKHLDQWTEGRQANAALYDELLGDLGLRDRLHLPKMRLGERHIYNQYVIRTSDRDGLRHHLTEKSIGTEIYYPLALHEQACFAYLGYDNGAFPNASRAAGEVLALPIYPELSQDQIGYVAQSIAEYFGS